MKIKSVNTLHVAATQWLDTADLNDLFPEHLRNVVDNQPEFCGWQGVYVKNNFAVATARWQTKTIPAGAVEAEMQRMELSGQYQHISRKELKETAKQVVEKRVPYAVKEKTIVVLRKGDTHFAIGINMDAKAFKTLTSLVFKNVSYFLPNPEPVLRLLTTEDVEYVHATTTLGGGFDDVFLVGSRSNWKGADSGVVLQGGQFVRLTLDHVRGSCRDHNVLCTYAEFHATQSGCALGVKGIGGYAYLNAGDLEFDFSQKAQDTGDAAGNAEYWYKCLLEAAQGAFAFEIVKKDEA